MRVGAAWRPKPGEVECGDRVVVLDDEPDRLLVAVIDGLGHGARAASAADAAARFVTDNRSLSLVELFERCHRSLGATRGVAMTVVRVDRTLSVLTHAAVGNVELVSMSQQRFRPIPEPGVVGGRLRRVREAKASYGAGDLFVLLSDGVSSRLDLEPYRALHPQDAADAIIRQHAKDHDDASCAVLAS